MKAQKENELAVTPYAIALYPFVGKLEDELSFKTNDIILLIQHIDKNWIQGELDGNIGIFPSSFVSIEVDCPNSYSVTKRGNEDCVKANFGRLVENGSEILQNRSSYFPDLNKPIKKSAKANENHEGTGPRFALVLQPFKAVTANELSVSKGERVTVIQQIDSFWIIIQNEHNKTGMCPIGSVKIVGADQEFSNTVTIDPASPDESMGKNAQTSTGSTPSPNMPNFNSGLWGNASHQILSNRKADYEKSSVADFELSDWVQETDQHFSKLHVKNLNSGGKSGMGDIENGLHQSQEKIKRKKAPEPIGARAAPLPSKTPLIPSKTVTKHVPGRPAVAPSQRISPYAAWRFEDGELLRKTDNVATVNSPANTSQSMVPGQTISSQNSLPAENTTMPDLETSKPPIYEEIVPKPKTESGRVQVPVDSGKSPFVPIPLPRRSITRDNGTDIISKPRPKPRCKIKATLNIKQDKRPVQNKSFLPVHFSRGLESSKPAKELPTISKPPETNVNYYSTVGTENYYSSVESGTSENYYAAIEPIYPESGKNMIAKSGREVSVFENSVKITPPPIPKQFKTKSVSNASTQLKSSASIVNAAFKIPKTRANLQTKGLALHGSSHMSNSKAVYVNYIPCMTADNLVKVNTDSGDGLSVSNTETMSKKPSSQLEDFYISPVATHKDRLESYEIPSGIQTPDLLSTIPPSLPPKKQGLSLNSAFLSLNGKS